MTTSRQEKIQLHHEGSDLEGVLFFPEAASTPLPAILLFSSAMGVGPAYRRIARRLADEGYLVLAADMYGSGAYFEAPPDAHDSYTALMNTAGLIRSRAGAWFGTLVAHPDVDPVRIATIGYCLGGKCALEIARAGFDLQLTISFHGALTTELPAEPNAIKGLVAIFCGDKDPYAPPPDTDAFVDEMRRAGARWQSTVFGDACHAFTTPEDGDLPIEGVAYDPLADALSWNSALVMLASILGRACQPGCGTRTLKGEYSDV